MPTFNFKPTTTFGTVSREEPKSVTETATATTVTGEQPSIKKVTGDTEKEKTSPFTLPKTTQQATAVSSKESDKASKFSVSTTVTPSASKTTTPATTTTMPTPAQKTTPKDTFKPLVSKETPPITISSAGTPTKSILKSSSTSKDTFGPAKTTTPSTVQTTIQSNITSIDQIKESTRFAQLPTDAQSVLLEAEQFINNQQLLSRNIRTRMDAFGGEDIIHVNTQVSELLNNASALKEQLQAQLQMITRLGTEMKQQLDATTISKVIADRGHVKRISMSSADHHSYFTALYERLRGQLIEFESAVGQIEQRLQQEMASGKSPQDLGMLISSQNQLFLSLSGKASELHQRVQSLLLIP
ncbi:uncharacterized protein BX664DRAFT_99409 [Halteromyces radiatus]|uniref:uncharacterized protein n=1 Tax=Halteromyces radiatus TaxID=101107 RepID=UPI00222086E6|nr:uncharacterized protein BX664DRAFT_99409 [Halteromyces radiatus]KAI8093034.1 hypothetical protein BX664DRAFT_99409 [Halteromyces radiatus]